MATGAVSPALAGLALLAGGLSFTSPCTLPLVPGFVAYMSGVRAARGRAALAALLFVAGFAVVFVSLGAAAGGVAGALGPHRVWLDRGAGVLIVALGLILAGALGLPERLSFLQRDRRPLFEHVRPGPQGALFLGVAFAVGWTPCVGPVLGAILGLAASRATLQEGALLLLLYALGIGVPFVAAAVFIDRFGAAARPVRRLAPILNVASGGLLVVMGILVATESLNSVLAPLLSLYASLHWPPI